MSNPVSPKSEDASSDPGDAESSGDDEVKVEDLLSSIMKGVSKAFSTSTAKKSKAPVKYPESEPPKQPKKPSRVQIRALPNESSEINERKFKKIANNGVVKLFELLNQS